MSKHTHAKTKTLSLKPLAALIPMLVFAAPIGAVETGHVAAGSGTINTQGATTTINQQSDRMIVNWNNFDIGAGETVQIHQPNAQSAILNRVNAAKGTQIDGALNANGRVFVINPNGVVVGKTGSINANGVVLSTVDYWNDDDFMQAGPGFLSQSFINPDGVKAGAVVNEGVVNAGAAGVSLFGSQVINASSGTISAKGTGSGNDITQVNLIASNAFSARETVGTGSLLVSQDKGLASATTDGLVANDGAIKVNDGNVRLSIAAGSSTLSEALRNTGAIEASGTNIGTSNDPIWVNGLVKLESASYGGPSTGPSVHLGGSIAGVNATLASNHNTVVDGAINATQLIDLGTQSIDARDPSATLTVADTGTLNGSAVSLRGDKVVVNGHATATAFAEVIGTQQAEVRAGALDAPTWTINDGGKITSGSGNGPTPSEPVNPGEPEQPADPDEPTQPVEPVDPETPVDPVTPIRQGIVAAGTGTIDTNGAATTINQQSDRLIISWDNFDIGAGERVQFNQPDEQAAVLNRVNSASRTQIDGSLMANGRVFVINPYGVVVGRTGSINANGVVLSTLDVADNAFMTMGSANNPYTQFNKNMVNGAVVNEGTINAGVGGVSLFGAQVINSATGSIYANSVPGMLYSGMAGINLVAGDAVEVQSIDPSGTYGMTTRYKTGSTATLVANDGTIKNDYGFVNLLVAGGVGSAGESLRNTGSIEARNSTQNGQITLEDKSTGANAGTYVGGSISGDTVWVTSSNDTTIDGSIRGLGIYATVSGPAQANKPNGNATLSITDNARLTAEGSNIGQYLDLTGDNVVVNGQLSSNTLAQVRSYNRGGMHIRASALSAPSWTIKDGGNVTTGSGSNGAIGLDTVPAR